MKKLHLSMLTLCALLTGSTAMAQMNVGSSAAPNANAALQVTSSNKGLLLPTPCFNGYQLSQSANSFCSWHDGVQHCCCRHQPR